MQSDDSAGQIWKCLRSCQKGVHEYERTFKQEQHDLGVIRGDDAQQDLNGPGVKVLHSSGRRTSSLIEIPCKECNGSIVSMYHEELEYLVTWMPFKCMHGIKVTSLSAEYSERRKETAVPRPLETTGVSEPAKTSPKLKTRVVRPIEGIMRQLHRAKHIQYPPSNQQCNKEESATA